MRKISEGPGSLSRWLGTNTHSASSNNTFRGRALRVIALSLAGLMVLSTYAVYTWLDDLNVFSIDEAKLATITEHKPADNSLVFDRNGNKIGEFFSTYQIYIPFEKIPTKMVQAILAIEDRNFYKHYGFDIKGILRATLSRLIGHGPQQGASTITQQIVRNFLLTKDRTINRKIQEVALAVNLEKRLSKPKILEIYANALFLGNGSYGVGAAAHRYFGKSVGDLTVSEMALIAGLFQSPSRYNPVKSPKLAKSRQLQVIKAMEECKFVSHREAKALKKDKLEYKEYRPINSQISPYFVDYIHEEAKSLLKDNLKNIDGKGLRIYTTLDAELQKMADESFLESKKILDAAAQRSAPVYLPDGKKAKASLEAALLSIDHRTGEVLAMIGGRDYRVSKFNRTFQALRSPGSAFKPVIYSLALSQKYKWSDMIFVSPITINSYRPHTPDEDYLTETTLLRAFYRSMNTPTVELGQKLGLLPVIQQAKLLGIRSPIKEEFGSMLGSSDVNMFDMARMYGTFANMGRQTEIISIQKITDLSGKLLYQAVSPDARTKEVISPQIAFLMTQGMRAVLGMGTGFYSSHLANVAAGKTGTSNDATDNWFCGFTANLTTIVWVGTDEHTEIHGDTTGGKTALPIWDRYITKALEYRKPEPFPIPQGIVAASIHPKYGNRSPMGVRMYFIRGQEPPDGNSALEELSQSGNGVYRDVFNH